MKMKKMLITILSMTALVWAAPPTPVSAQVGSCSFGHGCSYQNNSYSGQQYSRNISTPNFPGWANDQASSLINARNYCTRWHRDNNYIGWSYPLSQQSVVSNLPNDRNDEISSMRATLSALC